MQPLDATLLNGQPLGLQGEHQLVNAALAVALVHTWLQKTGHEDLISLDCSDNVSTLYLYSIHQYISLIAT